MYKNIPMLLFIKRNTVEYGADVSAMRILPLKTTLAFIPTLILQRELKIKLKVMKCEINTVTTFCDPGGTRNLQWDNLHVVFTAAGCSRNMPVT